MSRPKAIGSGTAYTHNTAGNGSNVGIQAETVADSHVYVNSTVYQASANHTAAEKFQAGVRYLRIGVPGQARELIYEAIVDGYDTGEVRFHWVLAMFSKRSYQDLTRSERDELARTADRLSEYADNEWWRALTVVCDLLESLTSQKDPDSALTELMDLPGQQRELIERHLDLVLTGRNKDRLWAEMRGKAVRGRENHNRRNRVWAYFQPDPFEARARPPAPKSTTAGYWVTTIVWTSICAAAAGYIGWTVLTLARPWPILGLVAFLASLSVTARTGSDWRYRVRRLRLEDLEHLGNGVEEISQAPPGGFANRIDHLFTHYFTRRIPDTFEPQDWLETTAAIRRALRNEIVEIYRESRIPADRVRWLVRFLAGEVKRSWETGTERDYRTPYQTPLSTKALYCISLTIAIITAPPVVIAAFPAHPLSILLTAVLALGSGRSTVTRWLHIAEEHRRFEEDELEYKRVLGRRRQELVRWKTKLEATAPSEQQMEDWLYCDTMVLLGNTLRHYQLPWRDVVAHTFLQAPAKNTKKARAKRGPWRYSRYDIRLFLITRDGVREVCGELDFEHISFDKETRRNYRFDAVSSVHVAKTGRFGHVLDLTLSNGPTRNIHVTQPETTSPDPDEDLEELARMNLDTTGFARTLHILEGIAAEGRQWMNRDPYANADATDAR